MFSFNKLRSFAFIALAVTFAITSLDISFATASDAAQDNKEEKKIKYWVAPMDPNYVRSKPGKSPMGMDLVPVYDDGAEESDTGTVRIDPVTVQSMGVRTRSESVV